MAGSSQMTAANSLLGLLASNPERNSQMMKYTTSLLLLIVLMSLSALTAAQITTVVPISEDQVVYELVGQFNNNGAANQQFGYLTNILGLSPIFTGAPQNQTTALFTFVTNATTSQAITNGPFVVLHRTGTTTIYLNTPPSDFSNPASFSQGTPIQISSYSQQVIVNTTSSSFTTVHTNTVTSAEPFSLNGQTYRLGQVGKAFRTVYSGQVNTGGTTPTGWFAGNSVGIKK